MSLSYRFSIRGIPRIKVSVRGKREIPRRKTRFRQSPKMIFGPDISDAKASV
jgi:hypothetical protein